MLFGFSDTQLSCLACQDSFRQNVVGWLLSDHNEAKKLMVSPHYTLNVREISASLEEALRPAQNARQTCYVKWGRI